MHIDNTQIIDYVIEHGTLCDDSELSWNALNSAYSPDEMLYEHLETCPLQVDKTALIIEEVTQTCKDGTFGPENQALTLQVKGGISCSCDEYTDLMYGLRTTLTDAVLELAGVTYPSLS